MSGHPDALAVDRFAVAMKAKLAQKRAEGRGGWEDKDQCSNALLSRLLVEHVQKGDPIDVANFCMMLHQRGELISPAPSTTPEPHVVVTDDAVEAACAVFYFNWSKMNEDGKDSTRFAMRIVLESFVAGCAALAAEGP